MSERSPEGLAQRTGKAGSAHALVAELRCARSDQISARAG